MKQLLKHFKKIVKESNQKPNKIWVDKYGEFDNRLMKSWLHDNDTDIYATHNASVIRQKGESQNGCLKKAKHAKISEKQTFLTP